MMDSMFNKELRQVLVARHLYDYKAEMIYVVDGDTIDFKIDLGFHMTKIIRVRLLDIDTPELRGGTVESKLEAGKIKQFVYDILIDEQVKVITEKTGSFGRWLADVWFKDGDTLSEKIRAKFPQVK